MQGLSDRERLDRLRLCRSEHVGPITFLNLMRRSGDAGAALDAAGRVLRRYDDRLLPHAIQGSSSRVIFSDDRTGTREVYFVALDVDGNTIGSVAAMDSSRTVAAKVCSRIGKKERTIRNRKTN